MMKILALVLCMGWSIAGANQCCPGGELIMKGGRCGLGPMLGINCTHGRMMLRDIILNGNKLSTQDSPEFIFAEDPTQYCLGKVYRNKSNEALGTVPVAVVCFEEVKSKRMEISGILTIVSVFFLAFTFAVYTYIPTLRDLQGLCYMCMCVSMALGFLSLGILQLSPGFEDNSCKAIGFLLYFWMMATFFWMNVISINMYRSVQDSSYLQRTEKTQYFWYSCYAWGATLLFLTVALVTSFVEGNHWQPGFGESSCWFKGRAETWIFFYGPIAVIVAVNVVLFILSSFSLWRQTRKYEMNKLNNLKHKFLLSLKLFLVMGISWIFEVASFAHGGSHIVWTIMDIFNCLQGVVIFVLLVVLRRRAIKGLVSENCCLPITRPLAEKLSPHDDSDGEEILADETVEVRLN